MKLNLAMPHSELPTSMFLPYFVRFLKENTAVCMFLFDKIHVFFFFLLESESSEIYTHYLCYEKLVRVFELKCSKIRLRLHQRASKPVSFQGQIKRALDPGRKDFALVMHAPRAKILFSPQNMFF